MTSTEEARRTGAERELSAALSEVGVGVDRIHGRIYLDVDDRRSGPWEVWPVGTVTAAQAATMTHDGVGRRFVVANRTYRAAVDLLAAAGIGFYGIDTGRLVVRGDGLRIDHTLSRPRERTATQGSALTARGYSGIVTAYELLDHPARPLSPRRDANRLHLSSSALGRAVRALGEHGLLDEGGRALTPELFIELAGVWRPERTWLTSPPDPGSLPVKEPGVAAASGPAGALAWGAPIVASEDSLDLYLPTVTDVRLAVRRLGPAPAGSTPWTIAAAPAWQACQPPAGAPTVGGFTAAPILAVALDLANDPARGAQVLEEWTPDPEVHARVW